MRLSNFTKINFFLLATGVIFIAGNLAFFSDHETPARRMGAVLGVMTTVAIPPNPINTEVAQIQQKEQQLAAQQNQLNSEQEQLSQSGAKKETVLFSVIVLETAFLILLGINLFLDLRRHHRIFRYH